MILVPMTAAEAVHVRHAISIAVHRHDGQLDADEIEHLIEVDHRIVDHADRHVGTRAVSS